jgi:hypothetical protein
MSSPIDNVHSLLLDALDNLYDVTQNKDSLIFVQTLLHKASEILNTITVDDTSDNDAFEINDDKGDCDYDSDSSFTDEQRSFIKNKSHELFLKKYSLVPTFLHQYYDPNRDIDTE